MNLNSVTLCFQGFIKDENVMRPITNPVYSNPINNLSKFKITFILIKSWQKIILYYCFDIFYIYALLTF